ncbi:MAG: hypothetical protein PVI23_08095 [Maricaulaceae bacterium]
MRQFLTFILFVLALGGLGWLAVNPAPAAVLTPYADVAHRIEVDLEEKANATLDTAGLDWASVEMDGQIAVLRGLAPREEERAEAIAYVRDASGHGPWSRGGVMAVRDRTDLAPPASPFEWRAVREGDRVILGGHVPTRAARAELVAHAGELFSGGVVDRMEIARGAPDEFAWSTVARTALTQLASLSEGEASLRDVSLTIEGAAGTANVRARVRAALANLPAPFLAAALVDAPESDGAADAVLALAPTENGLQPLTDPAACDAEFDAIIEEAPVEFAAGEAAMTKESYPVLDQLALTALRCEGMRFAITASGDPDAGDEAFTSLGAARAQQMADYFVLQGVALDRLETAAHPPLAAAAEDAPEAGAPAGARRSPAAVVEVAGPAEGVGTRE